MKTIAELTGVLLILSGGLAHADSDKFSQDTCEKLAAAYHDNATNIAHYDPFKVDVGNIPSSAIIMQRVVARQQRIDTHVTRLLTIAVSGGCNLRSFADDELQIK